MRRRRRLNRTQSSTTGTTQEAGTALWRHRRPAIAPRIPDRRLPGRRSRMRLPLQAAGGCEPVQSLQPSVVQSRGPSRSLSLAVERRFFLVFSMTLPVQRAQEGLFMYAH